MTCITITSIPWYVYAIMVLFIGMQGKGDSRIFLWRFLSSLHSKAAIGSFLLGGSGGMLPQENFENWGIVDCI